MSTKREPRWLAPAMFGLSLAFLVGLAAVLVLWIDVPRANEDAEFIEDVPPAVLLTPEELEFEERAYAWGGLFGLMLLAMWPFFIAEKVFNFCRTESLSEFRRKHPFAWLIVLLPPLRLCELYRDNEPQLWLPGLGWQVVDRKLQKRLERLFSVPMIWIALLILPVLGLQFYFKDSIVDYPNLRFVLHFSTGLIWFAFTVEFIVMVSVAEKKLTYCKKHWLELAIILLPLISFLRTLRILKTTKLLKFGKLQQVSRVIRVYRLRGVAMRGLRALMLLEVVHRLMRVTPEQRVTRLEQQYREKLIELEEIEEEIEKLKSKIAVGNS